MFDENFCKSIDIHTLLPQQPPFVMVGRLLFCDGEHTRTETVIDHDNIFVKDNLFTAPGILENIAQTCAAGMGFTTLYIKGEKNIRIGVIGTMKGFEFTKLPHTGDNIVTQVDNISEFMGMILAHACVTGPDGIITEGEIKIAVENGTENS